MALTLFAVASPAASAAPTQLRLLGNDRYATSAKVSQEYFNEGVGVVYVATGESFPDALSAAPAAAHGGGPVLLTRRDALPEATSIELDRLKPLQIVVLGGTTAISDAVVTALDAKTEGAVTRLAGFDRYETSAKVTEAAFTTTGGTVYIATGVGYADALAGAPAAGALGGRPLLLVRPDGVPGFVANELARLTPQTIIILGGTSAVPTSTENQLKTFAPNVIRRAGGDRYLTALAVSADFTAATKVFLATGTNFPDALAAGSPAGLVPGPLLLVRQDCMQPEVDAEISRLNPDQIVVLGGPEAVSNATASRELCEAGS